MNHFDVSKIWVLKVLFILFTFWLSIRRGKSQVAIYIYGKVKGCFWLFVFKSVWQIFFTGTLLSFYKWVAKLFFFPSIAPKNSSCHLKGGETFLFFYLNLTNYIPWDTWHCWRGWTLPSLPAKLYWEREGRQELSFLNASWV